jgi:hypothetical protein
VNHDKFKLGDRVRIAAKSPSTTRGMAGKVTKVRPYNPMLPDSLRYYVELDGPDEDGPVPYKEWELEPE